MTKYIVNYWILIKYAKELSWGEITSFLSYLFVQIVQSFAAEYLKTPLGEPVKSKKNKSSTELWVEKFVGFTCTPFIIPC